MGGATSRSHSVISAGVAVSYSAVTVPVSTSWNPASATSWVNLLADVGARRPLVVATGRGAGPVPTEQQAEVVVIDTPHRATMTEELRDQDRIARHLPPEARAAMEAYDPDGEALWMMGPFVVNEPVRTSQGRGITASVTSSKQPGEPPPR